MTDMKNTKSVGGGVWMGSGDIPPLTGVRAFAAWWVVFFHASFLLPSAFPGLHWLAALGYLGVDLFFVLSGFIISYKYWNRFSSFSGETYRNFLWLRLARLYPVHIFTLFVSALLLFGVRISGIVTSKDFSTWTLPNFLANLVMVHAWRIRYVESWNNASWSISCEWFAYLVFPLLVLSGLKKIPTRVAVVVAMLLPGIYAILAQAKYFLPFALLVKVLLEFTAGCLIFHAYSRCRNNRLIGKALGYGAAVLSVVVLIMIARVDGATSDWFALVFPLAIFAIAMSSGILAKLLGSRQAVYWGKVSYSLYMTHNVTLWLLKALLPVRAGGLTVSIFVIYLVSISVVAILTYHFVEEPARKWMRARGRRKTAVAVA